MHGTCPIQQGTVGSATCCLQIHCQVSSQFLEFKKNKKKGFRSDAKRIVRMEVLLTVICMNFANDGAVRIGLDSFLKFLRNAIHYLKDIPLPVQKLN